MSTSAAADPSAIPADTTVHAKVGLSTILLPVLLSTGLTLAVVGGAAFWALRSGKLKSAAVPVVAAVPTIVIAPPPSHVLALEPMIVNLSDSGGRSYLRAAVSLRIRDEDKTEKKEEAPKDPKAADPVATALRDTTLNVLSSESAEGLLAPEGRESVKVKLDTQYKLHNAEARVLEVYFTEFLVQRG